MKRTPLLLVSGALLCALAVGGLTAASGSDPLISLSYLNNTFLPQLLDQSQSRVDTGLEKTYQSAIQDIGSDSSAPTEDRYKSGDQLTLTSGSVVVPMAGQLQLTSGTAVDVTDGTEMNAPVLLTSEHRYIISGTSAVCTVASETAVLTLGGNVSLASSSAPDYNGMADALKAMGLFQGSGWSVGSGYELENTPTRIQGLIMFLRLLGEEEAALATTASSPFHDVADWAQPYVAYAYEKGYTNGVDLPAGLFGSNDTMTSAQYVTLLLRALGYSDTSAQPDFNWAASVAFGQNQGLFTAGEYQRLTTGTFTRAQVAYVSFYALDFPLKGSTTTLLDRLISAGVTTQSTASAAKALVTTNRL